MSEAMMWEMDGFGDLVCGSYKLVSVGNGEWELEYWTDTKKMTLCCETLETALKIARQHLKGL